MSEKSAIQSKIEFCVSFFPQEYIEEILDRTIDDNSLISMFIEGIYKASELLYNLLSEYWHRSYESITLLNIAKQSANMNNPLSYTSYQILINTCKKDLNLIDVSLIHEVRNELNIVSKINDIKDLLNRLSNNFDSLVNSSIDSKSENETHDDSNDEDSSNEESSKEESNNSKTSKNIRIATDFTNDNIDILYEYFISCQYYRNILKNKSRIHEFKEVINIHFRMINMILFSNGKSIIKFLESYIEMFVIAVTDNFIISKSYKDNSNCMNLIRNDLKTRDIGEFDTLKLLFTSSNNEYLKPFIWFDSKYDENIIYNNDIESLENIIKKSLKDARRIDVA